MATITLAPTVSTDHADDLAGDVSSTTVLSSSTTQITLGLTYGGDDLPHASTLVITGTFPASDLSSGTITSLDYRDAGNASLMLISGLSLSTANFNAMLSNEELFEDFIEDIVHAQFPGTDFDDHGGRKDDDTYNGTGSDDTVHYDDSSKKVNVNLTSGSSRGQGNDTLIGIENVVGSRGSDSITGSDLDNVLDGNDGNDKLFGLAGDDELFGGKGNDHLNGGEGDDDLLGDKGNDHLDGGAGNDFLDGDDGNDKLTGGDGDDEIHGGSGNDNIIAGNGFNVVDAGSGNDKITAGDDDDIIDAGSGNDTIMSGAGNDTINGGAGKDNIKAGDGDDFIDGGADADKMAGGAGNDTYVVDNAKDKIVEKAGEGNDTVIASSDFSLAKLANVENIQLSGTGAFSATGNAGANILDGNAGSNLLTGGAGADVFLFDDLTGTDTIADFVSGTDEIWIDNSVFTAFTTDGALAAGNFVSGAGAVALDGDDYLVFDTTSGALYYDANGSTGGSADAVQIATLSTGTLVVEDVTVI